MNADKTGLVLAVCAAVAMASCARKAQPGIVRLAVLRFENLGADPAADWMGRAFAEVIASELAGAPGTYAIPPARLHTVARELGARPAGAPGISAEAPLALVAGASRIAYGSYNLDRGKIHARMTIEDPQTRRVVRELDAVTAADPDVAAAATALARQIWPQAPAYGVRNAAALQAYSNALEAGDLEAVERQTRQAIANDPDFGAAYLLLADMQAQRRDRAALTATLTAAAARGTALGQADRARLENLAAGLNGDTAARERAMGVLVRLTPNDPAVWRGMAEIANGRHQSATVARAYERALAIEPADANSWNQLAYAEAAGGNLPAAMGAVRRYQALQPANPNPVDSMGDVNLICGRLKEAEQFYLQAAKMAPAFLNGGDHYKAAVARLMTGDVAGADALYQEYPAAAVHRGEWLWMSGRRKQGYETLAREAPGLPNHDGQAVAYTELAIWSLIADDRGAAAAMAQKAVEAAGPASAGLAALARFLAAARPLGAAEWAARAQQFFPDPNARNVALGYALLLSRQFGAAVEPLRRVYDGGAVSPESGTPAELGWALAETGQAQEAAELLRANTVPAAGGPGPQMAFYWPTIFHARAIAAEKLGKADEVRANAALFEKLSGR